MRDSLSWDVVNDALEYRDGRLFWKKPARGRTVGKEAGTTTPKGYRQIHLLGNLYLTHRLVWLLLKGEWPDSELDHVDGDRSNNKLENLRLATRTEQRRNSSGRRSGSSRYKGVSLVKPTGRWAVRIQVNGKPLRLGNFDDEELASLVYDEAARKYYGEFARTNTA